MPSYFYHIALEILPDNPSTLASATSAGEGREHQVSLAFESACEALRPFQKNYKNRSQQIIQSPNNSPSGAPQVKRGREGNSHHWKSTVPLYTSSRAESSYAPGHGQHQISKESGSGGGLSTPPLASFDVNVRQPVETDLRFDKISIQSIDMVAASNPRTASFSKRMMERRSQKEASQLLDEECDESSGNDNENSIITTGIGTDILGGLYTRGRYIPLDQQLSDSVWGIVHLYRDAKETPGLTIEEYPSYLKGSSAARHSRDELGGATSSADGTRRMRAEVRGSKSVTSATLTGASSLPDEDCTTLCILAVPSYLSPSDFLGFVGEGTRDDVSHFRMIRTARANRYMVLMKFRSGKNARDWQREWNGKVFNSMEPETCHVVFVKSVEIQAANVGSSDELSNTVGKAPTTSSLGSNPSRLLTTSPNQAPTLSSKPLAPPTPSLIELPTCPVCLERMDETSGLLTIICQHVFHCTCLQKWKGSGCPVCRYTLDDFGRRGQHLDVDEDSGECSVCQSQLNLWICLICGNIGCGRYDLAHAFAHFKETSHTFAMDLSTQRVWDYVSDAYVHRIIQSKSDGKLVELPAADNSALDPPDWSDAVPREKMENMSVEYTHLLTSQLESQRAYFEEILERAVDKASKASAAASAAQEATGQANSSLQHLQRQYDTLITETVPGLERERERADRRAERFETMARKMEKEWREEKAMNENLVQRVEILTDEVEKLKLANADLVEQNRDLSFFISGSAKLQDQGEDVVEGTISLPEESTKKKKGKGRKR